MADSCENRMNLAALKRVDPYINGIVDTASQVALYKFNAKTNEWEGTEIEGTLFVYSRSAPPLNGFLIMNRLNTNNLIEPVTREMDFQRQDPFLLYRNSKLNIYGIWFYNREDCAKIDKVMKRLSENVVFKKDRVNRLRRASESDTMSESKSLDIISMLTKAQDEYNKAKAPNAPARKISDPKQLTENPNISNAKITELVRPKAVRAGNTGPPPDVTSTSRIKNGNPSTTSLSVADLFASAGQFFLQQQQQMSSAPNGYPPQWKNDSNTVGTPIMANPLLQRLLSNPENTVEHIERRQRNEVPEPPPLPNPPTVPQVTSMQTLEQNLRSKLNVGLSQIPMEPPTSGVAAVSPSLDLTGNTSKGGSSVLIPNIMDQNVLQSSSLQAPILPSHQSPVPAENATQSLSLSSPKPCLSSTIPLMSPMMFASPRVMASDVGVIGGNIPQDNHKPFLGSDESVKEVLPLTRKQLAQAFTYLLKNDSEFVEKLHEAYVKSLHELTSSKS